MNLLEQLKTQTKVVADTGDIASIKKFTPIDATTNPSLLYAASQDNSYAVLIDEAIKFAKNRSSNTLVQLDVAVDKLIVNFGLLILDQVPGRVSTETDPRLSFDTEGIINKARDLIALYEEAGADRKRVLIKIVSTWEGIKAAERLEKEGIRCNMTLLFSLPQAIACADAKVQLISPFVGRVLDWYAKSQNAKYSSPDQEPGVLLVKIIYNYYKKFGYKTEVMAASFRNTGEIIELAGCDLMTISPLLLKELEQNEGALKRKLNPEKAKDANIDKVDLDEKLFRWWLNEDAMATEKLAEGIRKFTEDLLKLEEILQKRL